MEDIKKIFSNMETALEKRRKTIEEKTMPENIADFLKECDKSVHVMRETLKRKLPVGVKRFIETKIMKLVGMRHLVEKKSATQTQEIEPILFQEIESVFQTRMRTGLVINNSYLDPKNFFEGARDMVINYVLKAIEQFHNIKVYVIFSGVFALDQEMQDKYFHNKNTALCRSSDLEKWFEDEVKASILAEIEDFEHAEGSGWSLQKITNLAIQINKYNPMRAGSWIKLPKWVRKKRQ